ncbi:MAG: sctT [Chlamydiales bacterium]|jgi:type III secretion protein T|nr:sctT [Chlamydiales bacterium]
MEDVISGIALEPDWEYTLLSLLFLFLLRILPILTQAPFMGSNILPLPTRVGMGIALFLLYFPYLWQSNPYQLGFNLAFLGYAAKEVFIGLVLGFLISLPYLIAQSAGALVDFQRGSSSLTAHDPVLKLQSSPIGTFYNYLLVLIFFGIGGPKYFLDSLLLSYEIVPITGTPLVNFFTNSSNLFWQSVISILHRVAALFVQLAAPPIVATLLADMFLGIANRLAPQVQITFLGMSLKSLLGIAFIFLGFNLLLKQMSKELISWMQMSDQIIRSITASY